MPGLVGGFGNYFLPIHCGAVDMAKFIKLNKFFCFHLKLLFGPAIAGWHSRPLLHERSYACCMESFLLIRRQNFLVLNYLCTSLCLASPTVWRASPHHQLNILFFYLFFYKLALFRPASSAAVTSIYPNLPASMMPYDIRALLRAANKQTLPLGSVAEVGCLARGVKRSSRKFSTMATPPLPRRGSVAAEGVASPALLERREGTKNSLNTYLTGLFEGDGHIWIQNLNSNAPRYALPLPLRSASEERGERASTISKKHNPRFCITFHLKDKPLAEKLLKSIGYGFIRIKLKENACVLTVSPLKGLIFVIQLLNGNMSADAHLKYINYTL